jgi:uncharacterized protein YceH (UPF0502 family)
MEPSASQAAAATERRWRALPAIDRRVLGVLAEKAKTTPDVYPMSVNALRSGCNQKNNRYPLMELEEADVEESLERLKQAGAAGEVQGGGRVPRFKHYLYDWLGVDKLELSVMTELLLRGAQTEGELRGRASRMDPIPDLSVLRELLRSLSAKGLVVSLTPEGRGHVVTHALYEPRELEKLRSEHADRAASEAEPPPSASVRSSNPLSEPPAAMAQLRAELEEVRDEVARLRKDVDALLAQLR